MEAITSPPMLQDDTTPHAFFNPLLISMLGIVVTSTAIIAYHLLLVKYCIRRHASATTAVQSTAAPQLCPGVDEKILTTIPILAFTAVKRGTDQLEECVVCLGELEDEDMVRLLPNCKHAFHVACIDQWFAAHANCPMCRAPILEQLDAEQSLDPNRAVDNSDLGGSDESSAIDTGREPPLSPRERSCRMLRHCASLVVAPMERTAPPRLKRSLSMDQSFVVINLERDNCSSDSSSSSSSASILTSGGSSSAPSMSHFDRVSSKWLRSFSRLRMGKGNNGSILPY